MNPFMTPSGYVGPKAPGNSYKPLYSIWRTMLQRCYNPKHNRYHRYGGRGITVTSKWWDFAAFESWATSNGYTTGVQIDRIDGDRPYRPDNCRWTSAKVQQNNRQNNVHHTWKGEHKTLAEWADDPRCAVSYKTLHSRVTILGWVFTAALTTPSAKDIGRGPQVSAFGTTQSLTDWVNDPRCTVASVKTLWKRIDDGWPVEKAIIQPVRSRKGR